MGEESQLRDISSLPKQDLLFVKQDLDQDILTLQEEALGVKSGSDEYKKAADSVGEVREGEELLVPICNSVYVHGKATNTTQFLIDVGGSYFVQKSDRATKTYCKKRRDLLADRLSTIESALLNKRKMLDDVKARMEIAANSDSARNSAI